MDQIADFADFEFHAGDRVSLSEDDWDNVGHSIILVDAEPVPGSTQCLIRSGDEFRTVSRASLRPA